MVLIQQPILDPRTAIPAANRRFMDAFARQDATAIAALYTDDAQLLPTGSDVVEGRRSIESFWRGAFGLGLAEARLVTVEVDARGDTAVEVGRYTMYGGDGSSIDHGKYLVVWKEGAGEWRLHRDIWTSSVGS